MTAIDKFCPKIITPIFVLGDLYIIEFRNEGQFQIANDKTQHA